MDAVFLMITFHVFPLLISSQLFSTGTFYARTAGQYNEMNDGDKTIISNENFFKCSARQSCSDVITIQGIDDEGRANVVQNVWKKIPNSYAQRNST